MHQDAERFAYVRLRGLAVASVGVLNSAHGPHDRGVDKLQVAGIGEHGDGDLFESRGNPGLRALMVFDVAGGTVVGFFVAKAVAVHELGQQGVVRLLEDVGKDVEPAPMRHGDHDGLHFPQGGLPDYFVQHRHQGIVPFHREPLLSGEAAVEEMFEGFSLTEPFEQRKPLVAIKPGSELAGFNAVLEPLLFHGVADVSKFIASGAKVQLSELGNRLLRRGRRSGERALHQLRRQAAELLFGDALERGLGGRLANRTEPQGVQVRHKMAVIPDAFHEIDHAAELFVIDGRSVRRWGLCGSAVRQVGRPAIKETAYLRVNCSAVLEVGFVEIY